MLGLAVIIAVSWGLVYLIRKENLNVLGFTPPNKRLWQFFLGVLAIFAIRLLISGMDTLFVGATWVHNPSTEAQRFAAALGYHIRSAATEDLIFRGVLLYLVAKRLGAGWAVLLSATAFGLYHFISYNLYSAGAFPIIHTILMTGLAGAVWAWAYLRSGSILLPFGMHLAWNYYDAMFYDVSPYGKLLFMQTGSAEPGNVYLWIAYYVIRTYLPILLMFLLVRYGIKPDKIQADHAG